MEYSVGETLQGIGIGNEFLSRAQIAQKIIRKNKWNCIKLKGICRAKGHNL
jgi:hypothetical protein